MDKTIDFLNAMAAQAGVWIQNHYVNVIMAIVIFIVGKWAAKLLAKTSKKVMLKANIDSILVDFLAGIIRVTVVVFTIVAALSQLGIQTASLIAIIGAAGLAVGLALKDSLQNFASGVMLILFRPFKSGDFVEMAGVSGVVEKISIFSTLMRSGDNKEIIVPNGKIYGGNIINFSARPTRRVDMVFGISYDDDIKKAKEVMTEILLADERVLKDPAPVVVVSALADSSVNFNVRPWVNSADYWAVYWDMHEKIKIGLEEAGLSIPYPQRDVHLHSVEKAS